MWFRNIACYHHELITICFHYSEFEHLRSNITDLSLDYHQFLTLALHLDMLLDCKVRMIEVVLLETGITFLVRHSFMTLVPNCDDDSSSCVDECPIILHISCY